LLGALKSRIVLVAQRQREDWLGIRINHGEYKLYLKHLEHSRMAPSFFYSAAAHDMSRGKFSYIFHVTARTTWMDG
jgi:hypothetical protein